MRYLREAGWDCRIVDAHDALDCDAVVFQKIYDSRTIELAVRLRRSGVVTVFDLCDNHFYNPDRLPALAERAERLERMLRVIDHVTVSSEPLRDVAAGREAVVIEDAVDEVKPVVLPRVRSVLERVTHRPRFELVWYGNAGLESPPFGLVHLPRIFPHLERLCRRRPLRLTVVSNSRSLYERVTSSAGFPHRYVEWSHTAVQRLLPASGACVIPIERNPFTICKTSNRIALALRLGVPVLADSIPSFEMFRPFVILDAWEDGLSSYASDPALRDSQASEGREFVNRTYTPERVVGQWGGFLTKILGRAETSVSSTPVSRDRAARRFARE